MKQIQPKLPELLVEVEKVALRAGSFIREEFGKISAHQAQVKSLNSLVSYVDLGAERMIVDALADLVPGSGFITEEETTVNDHQHYNWVIDPLDGTTNFLKGIPVFSVSIALTAGDHIVLGVVYDVMQDWCFSATRDGGTTLNRQPVRISKEERFEKAVIATGFPYHRLTSESPTIQLLDVVIERSSGIRRLGSAAIDLAYVSCGKVEGYYEADLNPWDLAAGILLVKEAGGIATDFDGGSAILTKGSVIAGNAIIQEELQQVIRQVLV